MAQRLLKLTMPMQHGADVRALQLRLRAHGYDPGPVDGIFGEKTLAAVRAFQKDKELSVDGIAGPLTLAALQKRSEAEAARETGDPRADFLRYLREQLGHIYVWGAQGEIVQSRSWIQAMETSAQNAARAVALYERRRGEGRSPIRAYDCSGLIMRFMLERGLLPYDMSSRGLYGKCAPLARDELAPGDLVFRHNGVRIYHVGVVMEGGSVIEAKGRDEGVIERPLDAGGTKYWNRYGRLQVWGA